MINEQLINPQSIAIIGASNNIHKPGGKILKNIIEGGYKGDLFVVNPKEEVIQDIKSFNDVKELPTVDCAIIAIQASHCLEVVNILANTKNTKAFIIISAGFSEEGEDGKRLEQQIVNVINSVNGCLIGPNCIGFINQNHKSVFTSPVPDMDPNGCDLISSSGATAVYLIESGIPKGLRFANIFSVGNSAQIGVEEVIEYMDFCFDKDKSPKIKLLYIETIKQPDKLLKHASSLISKGCKIAAIKSGISEAGSRAAASHTGALAGQDLAVEALLRKAGIVRCNGREELVTVASALTLKEIRGKNMAIITHAGGPAVMLTDALSAGGLNIHQLPDNHKDMILSLLNPGASAANPIDMLATGSAQQLGQIIEYCDKEIDEIDAMLVIFGSTGLYDVYDAYQILHEKILNCCKPIYPILPSVSSARNEVNFFLSKGHVTFSDEVLLGEAITKIFNTPKPASRNIDYQGVDIAQIREIIDNSTPGQLPPSKIMELLKAANIPVVEAFIAKTDIEITEATKILGFPLAIKVIGPIHKTDIGGVVLNINDNNHLISEFRRLIQIPGVESVMVQPMLSGIELFIGAKYEPAFGHVMLCGLGGIFIEVLKDVSSGLAPLTYDEAFSMIRSTKSYKIMKGYRGQTGINENKFAEILVRLSTLLRFATEIKEIDLNPLIGKGNDIFTVDARVLIQKTKIDNHKEN